MLAAKRDKAATLRFLERALNLHGASEKITIDKSDANIPAVESVKADAGVDLVMGQNKYLNNIVKQDQRVVKRITQPMLEFNFF